MAKQLKKSTGDDSPVLSQTLTIEFFSDTYYEGLPPFSPGIQEITLEVFKKIEGKGTYKIIEK
jgi:hypothetical protein